MRKLTIVLAITLLVMSALAGCGTEATPTPTQGAGGSAGSDKAAQEITITVKDDIFDPKSYVAEAGKPIKLTVVNTGRNVHEVEVKSLLPESKLSPGQSKTVEIPAQSAGTFRVYCEIHEDQGMEGEFIVK